MPRSIASAKPIDGRAREQELLDLAPDPLGRQIVERDLPAQARAVASSSANSNRAANCTARSTRRLSSAKVCGSTTRSSGASRSPRPSHGIEVLVGQRIPGDRVDREVAPPRRLVDRHDGIAGDDEAAVSAAGLRVAARQRDVDVADLVDLEAFADRFDASEGFEHRAQAIAGDAEDFEVHVRRARPAEQQRSRTQPPTTRARPPASRTARRSRSPVPGRAHRSAETHVLPRERRAR